MDTIIFDIDGTLADVSHRRHFVTGGNRDWDSFFEAMVDDPPLADVCLLAELLGDHPLVNQGAIKLFLLSGRPETYREETEKWLQIHAASYLRSAEALLMRAADDNRPDTEVKREMLNKLRAEGHEVRLVVDDRPSVIEMWKEEGLTVLAHDSGEWDGQNKPECKPGTLYLMVGPSGAGKSEFVRNALWKRQPLSKIVVSSDEMREEITGDFRDQSCNDQVFYAIHRIVEARINSGLDVLVDATNLRARDRRSLRDLCPQDTEIHYIVVDRPLEEKHRDAGWRDEVIIKGVKLIDRHHQSFHSGLKHIMRGDSDPRVTVHDTRGKLEGPIP
jgi:predicted kinase